MDRQDIRDQTLATAALLRAAEQALLIVEKKEPPHGDISDGDLQELDQGIDRASTS